MSRPAEVPHFRPAGSSPQFFVTFGAGFGSPSPVIGFATFPADWADKAMRESGWVAAVSRKTAQTPNTESRIRGVDITPPHEFSDSISVPGPAASRPTPA